MTTSTLDLPTALPLSGRLKTETQSLHTAAERHPFHQLLFAAAMPADRLASQHAAAGRVQAALERAVDAALPGSPELRAVFRDHHRRAGLYAADVAGLGAPAAIGACEEESVFIADLARADAAGLLGVLYVLEGSTNGGPFIQRALSRAMPGVTLKALSPHGDQQAARWAAFKESLDGLAMSEAQRATVVAWAGRTFAALCGMMSAVTAGMPPVTRASSPAH